MHPDTGKWGGDIDMRAKFNELYSIHFQNSYKQIEEISFDKYNLIIADDCRIQSGLGLIYQNRKCLMIGNSHGNNRFNYPVNNVGKCFDGCFVFGEKELVQPHLIPGGIPSNDKLKEYRNREKKHILLITNFLGNKSTYTDPWGFHFLPMDKDFFDNVQLDKLQQKYNKPIIIKIKSREENNYTEDINYIKSIINPNIEYKIVIDVEDDNLLIAESEIVLGHPSTMMLKPLQLGIPTVMFNNYGYGDQDGCIYNNCNSLIDLSYDKILETLNLKPDNEFIKKTVLGGINFNSTEYYISYIDQIING